jgi:acetyl esterase/lipase
VNRSRVVPLISALCVALALFATVWTVLPAPTYALWVFSVGATEGSLYFGLLGLLGAALGASRFRRDRPITALASVLIGLSAAGLSLVPLVEAIPVADAKGVSLSLPAYFGLAAAEIAPTPAVETATYAVHGGQRLDLDVYRAPATTSGPRPAIIVIHGGSWSRGHRSDFSTWDHFFAAKGYPTFDIDYRIAPQPNWQTAEADIRSAVAWVRTHAGTYGVNPRRICLLGRSAGGQLALETAYTAHTPDETANAVISLYGPTDLLWGYAHTAHPDVIDGQGTLRRYLGGTPAEIPDVYVAASPIDQVGQRSPPTLLLHGGRDRLVGPQHSMFLNQRLTENGTPHDLVVMPYALHGFDFDFGGWGSQIVRPVILRFLRDVFAIRAPMSAAQKR